MIHNGSTHTFTVALKLWMMIQRWRINQINLEPHILWYVYGDYFGVTMGSQCQNIYFTILLLWYHTGLDPDRCFQWDIQGPIISKCKSCFSNLVMIKEYIWNSTWSTLIYNENTICIKFSCYIEITWCRKYVGMRLPYFKSNSNILFWHDLQFWRFLSTVSINLYAILDYRIHKWILEVLCCLYRHRVFNMIKKTKWPD